ncbi:response regulator transcription factor [Psychrosphaera ytuae]|uniref:Response regulator transcription factor n=1 Tax=Psychrosphaera ytuae TaxID=2820710 RepID=A0A975HID7_9GAMM|nr:LytTR family DNA-binding domain-containing protein [Psychrosphaera ytuae]QTH64125.1 response regulator transcription factor [Psychrosphaera ytuae]
MQNTIRTIIVDDEPLARKGLSMRLNKFEQIAVVEQCKNGQQAIEQIEALKPDLVFLDIQMPGMTGFEVLKNLQEASIKMPKIVFVTAYDQYALQAFEVHAIDYLLKPVDEDRLKECIEKVLAQFGGSADNDQQMKLVNMMAEITGADSDSILDSLAKGEPISVSDYRDYISVKDVGETTRISVHDVLWVDAAGDYMCVHCKDGETHILRKTMKQLETELNPKLFVRVHRSVLVKNDAVKKVLTLSNGEYVIQLNNEHEIRVSRSYREKVRSLFL